MKCLREYSLSLLLPVLVGYIACTPVLLGQSASNQCCLKIDMAVEGSAVFTVSDMSTNASGPFDLFFRTNLSDPQGWTWLFRLSPGQTNLTLTNVPISQGFFILGVTNNIRPGFDQNALPPEDDDPSSSTGLPFAINFLGTAASNLWVNNNGNVTFDFPQPAYTPSALSNIKARIIAPFWADVDTRSPQSDVVRYGTNVVDGHAAFGVDWVNVGYYSGHADRLLSCQLVIIDRSDILPGDFDMEFNYMKVQWEWGDVSVGNPPRAGFSDGINDIELPGSGVEGAFLDTNAVTGLIYNSLKSSVPGRYIFNFRDGQPLP